MSGPARLIIIGGGEHARVVAEAAASRPEVWHVEAFVDSKRAEVRRGGPVTRWLSSDQAALASVGDCHFILGVGSLGVNPLRRRLVSLYAAAGARWAVVSHGTAWVSPTARVAPGVVLMAGVVINAGALIGAHAVVNSGAIIEHDVHVGPFAMVGPGAVVGGGCVIGADVFLGLGCRVRDHLEVGPAAMVGMGSVVVKSVPARSSVLGVPARPVRSASSYAQEA